MNANNPYRCVARSGTVVGLLVLLLARPLACVSAAEAARFPRSIRSLAFSADSKLFAAAASDGDTHGLLKVWNLSRKELAWQHDETFGFSAVAFSPRGRMVALGGYAPQATLIDVENGQVIKAISGHAGDVRAVAFSPDGEKLFTGSHDSTVKVWDLRSFQNASTLEGHPSAVYGIDISPEGTLLAAAIGRSRVAWLWDLETREPIAKFEHSTSIVPNVRFAPDGSLLAVMSLSGRFQLVDTREKKPLLSVLTLGAVDSLSFSPDQKLLAVANRRPAVMLFNIDRKVDERREARISSLIEALDDEDYSTRTAASAELAEMGLAPLPQLIAAQQSASPERRWRTRKLCERLSDRQSARLLPGRGVAVCVCFSPDGQFLARGNDRGEVVLLSTSDWGKVATFSLEELEAH